MSKKKNVYLGGGWWLSQKDREWCEEARYECLIKLPSIQRHSRQVAEQWRDEAETKERWKVMIV